MLIENLKLRIQKQQQDIRYRSMWQYIHIDVILFSLLMLLSSAGLLILFSASSQNLHTIELQMARLLFAFIIMFGFAQFLLFHYNA